MNTPSQGVAQALQGHVHLISSQQYPNHGSLSIEQAYHYLTNAPTIVKQHQPMSWTYVAGPQDGTVWLEWLPPEKTDDFPSDGYVWGDPEQTYPQQFGGFTMELKVQTLGYRPGLEQMFQHARTRYHFIAKHPSTNAPPPDPSLWIVHYHPADHNRLIPVNQIPIPHHMQLTTLHRRGLESQGRLDRRPFMLHDRPNWPTLNVPKSSQANARGQPGWPQPGGHGGPGGPPSKRARTQGPGSASIAGAGDGVHDTSIEDEENTSLGDFFDHLTQRDISLARYTQHHRWIEEVFSSPYGSHQIVPSDLGLGLMGEMKGLTEGILEPPNLELAERPDNKPGRAKEAPPLHALKQEQIDEFSKRVEKHLEEGRAEIERMKAEHAAKMQDWTKVKILTQAEKRLRYATWEGHESAVPAFRLELPAAVGPSEDSVGTENVEDIVKEVEDLLKTKISSHEHARRVARGGLKDRKPPTAAATRDGIAGTEQHQQTEFPTITQPLGVTALPTAYHEDPIAATQTANGLNASNASSVQPRPDLGDGAGQASTELQGGAHVNTTGQLIEDLPGMDMNDMMDMDVDDSNLAFDDPSAAVVEAAGAPSVPAGGQIGDAGLPNPTAAAVAPPTTDTNTNQPSASLNPRPETGGPGVEPIADDGDIFNDDAFGDLTNIDGGADDGLIDFESGGMGLDDSAFGDALHGMDAPDEDTNTPAA